MGGQRTQVVPSTVTLTLDELSAPWHVNITGPQQQVIQGWSDLIGQIQAVLDLVFSGDINVQAENNRVVFTSDDPFTIAGTSTNVDLLGMPGGNYSANEVVPDAEYNGSGSDLIILVTRGYYALVFNHGDGTSYGSISFTAETGTDMQSLVNQLNSELDDSILNDFRVVSEAGRLVFTNPYDFEISVSSVNAGVLGMTDVASATVPSIRAASTYEARGINSLFGSVLITGGYIAANNEIHLQNVDTTEHPYTGPDIGVRIQGSSEITTHDDYSLIHVDSKYDAEIEGHIIAGGEVRNTRDAETGGYIGSRLLDFGTDTAHTTILIEAEHQVRIGTVVRAGGLIELIGGNDPFEGDPSDIFNFTGASVLIYGSAQLETWGENSLVRLSGPSEIKVLTPTHFEEIEPDTWVKGEIARIVAEGQFMQRGYLPVPVRLHLWKRDAGTEYTEWITYRQ